MRTLISITLLLVLTAAGQQVPPGLVKFESTTRLVIVNVNVRDKDNKPIENLKASDFEVLEDGKPQKVSVFEFQRLEEALPPEPAPVARLKERPPAKGSDAAAAEAAARKAILEAKKTDIMPSKPGEIRYRDRRLMVFFFDFSSMPQTDQVRARDAALKFLGAQLTPSDLVSIMTFASELEVQQDFTQDRDLLAEVIKSFRIGEGSELATEGATDDEDNEADTGAAFTADESEFNIFNTDRKLTALETAVKMLASLPEKKAFVYFSSGVGKTGVENQSQLRATINAAVRSNVSFYPIDARGLVATAPAGDASVSAPKGSGLYAGTTQRGRTTKFADQQETLVTLAADTGGKALLDNNDLAMGITQAQKDISSYYILGYYSTNGALDGHFRRIRVRIPAQTQAKLDYRSGYFGPKEFKNFTASDKERQLAEALLLGDPVTDLTMAVEVDYFRLARDRYFIPVAVKIPGSEIELARKGGNKETEFDFIGQVRDPKGKLVGTLRDNVKVKLQDATAAKLAQRNLEYDAGFTLEPGDYTLKFLARENATGKMGTFEMPFNVPDVTAQDKYLRLSSVIWSNQREPMSAAVGSVAKDKKLLASHPLIQDGQKLVPSITHVFRKDQKLYVYFEVYDAAADPTRQAPSIAATLSFFRGRVKAFESDPIRVTRKTSLRPGTVSVELQLPLEGLTPGRYTCQVNVLDEVGKKFAFRRDPFVLQPPRPE
jgi:VWFA-related protein